MMDFRSLMIAWTIEVLNKIGMCLLIDFRLSVN